MWQLKSLNFLCKENRALLQKATRISYSPVGIYGLSFWIQYFVSFALTKHA